jgi:hypothetical protein
MILAMACWPTESIGDAPKKCQGRDLRPAPSDLMSPPEPVHASDKNPATDDQMMAAAVGKNSSPKLSTSLSRA